MLRFSIVSKVWEQDKRITGLVIEGRSSFSAMFCMVTDMTTRFNEGGKLG